jgi:hypothetical protein
MRLADCRQLDNVLGDVAANVLRRCGCTAAVVAEVVAELNAIVARSSSDGSDFKVQFRARAGSCEVVVFARDREIWRTSRRLPGS